MSREFNNRIIQCNQGELNNDGSFVLYWMNAFRRLRFNFALDRAISLATQLEKPLIILETVPCDEPWANLRHHSFIIDGIRNNSQELTNSSSSYFPFVETKPGAIGELLAILERHACGIVTDDFPSCYHDNQIQALARLARVRLEKVDSNGILPLRAANQVYQRAFTFRRFLQSSLSEYFDSIPAEKPLERLLPVAPFDLTTILGERWIQESDLSSDHLGSRDSLPIDYSVSSTTIRGGSHNALRVLSEFQESKLSGYSEDRNHPDRKGTSGLAPFLHHGHISPHEVFWGVMKNESWNPTKLASSARGQRSGWWGVQESAEAFLDQLVTWRELGYNMAWQAQDYDQYQSLPAWAKTTLEEHSIDQREYLYDCRQLENGATHDQLWNAAQVQLVRDGTIHNYLRMLWGKKILEWTPSPQEALEIMVYLNNKYALDGRDPNSYSGIFWILGRYDRPWGPERPVFGKVRYMSSANTARKIRLKRYLEEYKE